MCFYRLCYNHQNDNVLNDTFLIIMTLFQLSALKNAYWVSLATEQKQNT